MSEIDLSANIRKVVRLAVSLELDLHHGPRQSLEVNKYLKKLCKTSPYYREIYDYIATYKQYNLMLKDESCLQFYEKKNATGEQELRYAYYPNPYSFVDFRKEVRAIQQLFDNNEITHEEYSQLLNEAEFIYDIPLIRYDYSPSQYNQFHHPASHFPIGFHGENRWPVTKVLTPLVFFLKVLSLYYSDIWKMNFDKILEGKTLNDLYHESKIESYAVPTAYFGSEDLKRLTLS